MTNPYPENHDLDLQAHVELANTFRDESERILRELQVSNTEGDLGKAIASLEQLSAFASKWADHPLFASFIEHCRELMVKLESECLSKNDLSSLECLAQGCVGQMRDFGLLSGTYTLPSSNISGIDLIPPHSKSNVPPQSDVNESHKQASPSLIGLQNERA
jgi:hypothetical protein